jgi:hypothetical protein
VSSTFMTPTTPEFQQSPTLGESPEVRRESKRIYLPVDSEVYQQMVSDQLVEHCINRLKQE